MIKRQGETEYFIIFLIILLMFPSFMTSYSGAGRRSSTGTVNVSHLAGGGWGNVDGTGAAASFYNPSSITTDGTSLYIADYGNGTIRKIVIATGAVTTLAGMTSNGAVETPTSNYQVMLKDEVNMIRPVAIFLWRKVDHPGHRGNPTKKSNSPPGTII